MKLRHGVLHAGVVLILSLLGACAEPQDPVTRPPAAVSYLEMWPSELPLSLEYAAILSGVREVEVRARVSGILLERLYEEGSAVEAGSVLFRIDPAPAQAVAERVRAELDLRVADLHRARRERDRIVPVFERGLASVQERDDALSAYEAARAAVAAAEAALRTAELELSYTNVRAPISGFTSREVQSEGSLVTAAGDSSLLTHIVQTDRLYVDFSVPDVEAGLLRAAVEADASKLFVRVITAANSLPVGRTAQIVFIAPHVSNVTGTVAMRALLDNSDGALRPGLVARARIEGIAVEDAFVIPKRAILRGAGGAFVWCINDQGAVAPRPVELGVSSGNEAAVISGLSSGDRVIVDGILKVVPGLPVAATPIDPTSAGLLERASQ